MQKNGGRAELPEPLQMLIAYVSKSPRYDAFYAVAEDEICLLTAFISFKRLGSNAHLQRVSEKQPRNRTGFTKFGRGLRSVRPLDLGPGAETDGQLCPWCCEKGPAMQHSEPEIKITAWKVHLRGDEVIQRMAWALRFAIACRAVTGLALTWLAYLHWRGC